MNAKKIIAIILSLTTGIYFGILMISNSMNNDKAVSMMMLLPSMPPMLKLYKLVAPSVILEIGSFNIHVIPSKAETAIITNCTGVNGFNLPPFSSEILDSNSASDCFFGFNPISPKISFANQNCNNPNNMKIPAMPKPQDQPTFSPRYPQSMMPKNAPAFTPM